MPIWCHIGPSPKGIGAREKYSAGDTARPPSKAHAAFTTDGAAASSGEVMAATSVAISMAGSARGASTARMNSGGMVGRSPCRFTTTSCWPCGSRIDKAACTRSEPRGSDGSVSTTTPPSARTAAATSSSAAATATGPIPASLPRSSTCRIIARPWMSANGLPGSLVAAMRDGMMMIGFIVSRFKVRCAGCGRIFTADFHGGRVEASGSLAYGAPHLR